MRLSSQWETFKSRLFAADLKDYTYEINHENMNGMLVFLVLGEFVSGTALLFQIIGEPRSNYAHCIEMLLLFSVLLSCYFIYRKEWAENATAWLYAWEIVALILLIFQATAFDTDVEAFVVPLCLVIFPLFVIDVPWRLYLMVITAAIIFLIFDYGAKTGPLFTQDLLHMVWCIPISILLSYRNIYARLLGKVEKRKATQNAEHDVLTGILNRRGGEQLVRDCLRNGESGCYILMDIDNFKYVNDTYGHGRGDEILVAAAAGLKSCFRDTDIVFRMGGDEFIVYAPTMVDGNGVEHKLAEICAAMRKIILDHEKGLHLTVSLGCVINLGSYPTYEALYSTADFFLYQTKRRSKDGYSVTHADYRPDSKISEILKKRKS